MLKIKPVPSQNGCIINIKGLPIKMGITTRKFGNMRYGNLRKSNTVQRKKIKDLLRVNHVIIMRPEHKSKIITRPLLPKNAFPKCDGFLFEPGKFNKDILTGVPLGDCPAIWFYAKTVVGMNHSGWKSTRDKIAEKTILCLGQYFNVKPPDITAIIWPGICPKCYQVGPEFDKYFPGYYINGHIDLSRVIKDQLINAGIPKRNIHTLKHLCARCARDKNDYLFYSHRRGDKGRVLAYMII